MVDICQKTILYQNSTTLSSPDFLRNIGVFDFLSESYSITALSLPGGVCPPCRGRRCSLVVATLLPCLPPLRSGSSLRSNPFLMGASPQAPERSPQLFIEANRHIKTLLKRTNMLTHKNPNFLRNIGLLWRFRKILIRLMYQVKYSPPFRGAIFGGQNVFPSRSSKYKTVVSMLE